MKQNGRRCAGTDSQPCLRQNSIVYRHEEGRRNAQGILSVLSLQIGGEFFQSGVPRVISTMEFTPRIRFDTLKERLLQGRGNPELLEGRFGFRVILR